VYYFLILLTNIETSVPNFETNQDSWVCACTPEHSNALFP